MRYYSSTDQTTRNYRRDSALHLHSRPGAMVVLAGLWFVSIMGGWLQRVWAWRQRHISTIHGKGNREIKYSEAPCQKVNTTPFQTWNIDRQQLPTRRPLHSLEAPIPCGLDCMRLEAPCIEFQAF